MDELSRSKIGNQFLKGGHVISVKERKNFRLSAESISYVLQIQKEYNLNTQTAALEKIISEHKSQMQVTESSEQIVKAIDLKYKDMLTAIRLSSRFTDKNVQIILELLNTILVSKGLDEAYLTDVLPSGAFQQSKDSVEERIKRYREKQISNSKKKKRNLPLENTDDFLY